MLKNFALIGPKNKVSSFIKTYLKIKERFSLIGDLIAITITDHKNISTNYPCYSSWEEMLSKHMIDTVLNLETDPDFILNLRQNLPVNVQLSEYVPTYMFFSLFLLKTLYKQKADNYRLLTYVLENVPWGIIVFNSKGEVIYWNKTCEELTGVNRERVLGRTKVGFMLYNKEQPLLGQNILKYDCEELKKIYSPDISLSCTTDKHGSIVSGVLNLSSGKMRGTYQVMAAKILHNSIPVCAVEIIRNISSTENLKSQVREYAKAFELLLSKLPYPLVYTFQYGRIIYFNRPARILLGKVKKNNIFDVIDLTEKQKQSILQSLDRDKTKTFNTSLNDNELEVTVMPIIDKGVLWLFKNLTEIKSKQQLDLVLSLAGAISHELSQPLTTVVNATEVLAKTSLRDIKRLQRYQKIILEEGKKLFKVYNKLRNIEQLKFIPYLGGTKILDLNDEDKLERSVQSLEDETGESF
ncbi:MAG: PAS domain S-box protein [Desulfonauticus sp.]|nr:PAS domain S-box protein [Desulfonauticus sp.]